MYKILVRTCRSDPDRNDEMLGKEWTSLSQFPGSRKFPNVLPERQVFHYLSFPSSISTSLFLSLTLLCYLFGGLILIPNLWMSANQGRLCKKRANVSFAGFEQRLGQLPPSSSIFLLTKSKRQKRAQKVWPSQSNNHQLILISILISW